MLPRRHRLLRERDFGHVYTTGRSIRTPFFTLRFARNGLPHSRFAIVVSKRVAKSAVTRNSIKRQLREAARKCLHTVQEGFDVVLNVHATSRNQPFAEVVEALEQALTKAHLTYEHKS